MLLLEITRVELFLLINEGSLKCCISNPVILALCWQGDDIDRMEFGCEPFLLIHNPNSILLK